MKNAAWMAIVSILVLALGIETGYLLKMHADKAGPDDRANASYRAPVAPARPALPIRRYDPLSDEDLYAWDPFREMEDMQRVMNRLFQTSFSRGLQSGALDPAAFSYTPEMDVEEAEGEYRVRVDLPGIDKDKINVKVHNGVLTVSGERTVEKEDSSGTGEVYRKETSFGSFMRSLRLPPDADGSALRAESQNGVLTVHIPRTKTESKTKEVKVD